MYPPFFISFLKLDVPPKTEIGIDVHSWNTGEKFMGIKMIPPGIHYVFWRFVNTIFLLYFFLSFICFNLFMSRKGPVVVKGC